MSELYVTAELDDLLESIIVASAALPPERQQDIVMEGIVEHDPVRTAGAIARAIQRWKEVGMPDDEIQGVLARACRALRIDRSRGLN